MDTRIPTDSNIRSKNLAELPRQSYLWNRGDPMETVDQLLQLHADLFTSMYSDGILDNQFIDIHSFRDPEEPGFFKKLVDTFYKDSEKRLQHLATELEKHEVNYRRINEILSDFRDSSSSLGIRSLVSTCYAFKTCYDADKFEGCVQCLKYLKDEYFLLKRRLDTFLQLEHQILAAGQPVPILVRPRQNIKRIFNPK